MKSVALVLISFLCFAAAILGQRPGASTDILHYTFKVEVNDNNDSIESVATIRFVMLQLANHVTLDLVSRNADGKGMQVTSITENGKPLNYTHVNDTVHIQLSTPVDAGTEKLVQMKYKGIPADGLIIAKNKYGHRTFFSDHWPNRARNWLPCVDHPADKASVEFKIIAPSHYQVISNGVMIEETDLQDHKRFTHYREDHPLPMKIAAVGIANFAVHLAGEVNNIAVYSWVYPEDREKGFYDYGLAVKMLPFFIKNIGPYPFKKLANIQSKTVFGGMENAGAIFYYENSITGNRSAEKLIAHEIAHQWFGNMATEADWAHVWLSEGFATYFATLYMEYTHGRDTAKEMRIIDRMKAIAFSRQKATPIVDTSVTDYLELLNANSYQKGGWVLHMLRKKLGDSTFLNCIRSYYARYKGKNASTDDFRKILEEVSNTDQKKFFQQWLYTSGHPVLDIEWQYQPTHKQVLITIKQTQKNIFEFPIELRVIGSTPKEAAADRFMIMEKQTEIKIPVVFKATQLVADPSVDLFYEGSVKQRK